MERKDKEPNKHEPYQYNQKVAALPGTSPDGPLLSRISQECDTICTWRFSAVKQMALDTPPPEFRGRTSAYFVEGAWIPDTKYVF